MCLNDPKNVGFQKENDFGIQYQMMVIKASS